MRTFLILLLLITMAVAQMLPGSTNGAIANGRGGLGRFIRHLEGRDGSGYYGSGNGFGGYAPTGIISPTHNSMMRAATVILIVLLYASLGAAQLMPGSYNGMLVNGKGGLGRYIRHLEHHDQQSYYQNGYEFAQSAFSPFQFGFFG
ncbi:hypothetical protein PMAYCL1PPCAC_15997 [Pristionchus mayeri]|uniref:Uncharacterized protein n=1 Tax=Pristionchus mayeri TaxID=1317129 RepID=A0AAN5CJZ3_9BILA|nr:hypothetical protein PMAYCL1PPCAC_15997 [Pristionchus mayeri]